MVTVCFAVPLYVTYQTLEPRSIGRKYSFVYIYCTNVRTYVRTYINVTFFAVIIYCFVFGVLNWNVFSGWPLQDCSKCSILNVPFCFSAAFCCGKYASPGNFFS